MLMGSNDNQLWRKERLVKVRKVTATILGMSEAQLDKLVLGIYDSKGQLAVFWNEDHPTTQQKLAFGTAWGMSGENDSCVTHEPATHERMEAWF